VIIKIINATDVQLLDAKTCKFFAEGAAAWVVIDDEGDGGTSYQIGVKAYVMNQSGTTIDTFTPKR